MGSPRLLCRIACVRQFRLKAEATNSTRSDARESGSHGTQYDRTPREGGSHQSNTGGFRLLAEESRMRTRERTLNPVASEPCRQDGAEICFRARAGEIEVRLAQRVDQRTDHVRAADRDAAGRANVGAKAIQKHNLAVEQDDRDLGPVFGV